MKRIKTGVTRTTVQSHGATTPNAATAEKVSIAEWKAAASAPSDVTAQIVITTEDGRQGLLEVAIFDAFDDTTPWCELTVHNQASDAPGCERFTAAQINMPESLRKHILRTSLRMIAEVVADELAESRDEIPEFSAYVSATGLANAGYDHASLCESLIPSLKHVAGGDDSVREALCIPQLQRIAAVAKTLWGEGTDRQTAEERRGACRGN